MRLTDIGAEAALLGYYLARGLVGFLMWPVRAFVFTGTQHVAVYNAMERLAERGESIEVVTVVGELQRHDDWVEVRADFVAGLLDVAATSGGEVVRMLDDLATRRAMGRAADHLRAAAQNGGALPADSIDMILAALARETAAVGRLDAAPLATTFETAWLAALDAPTPDADDGIWTGLTDLDHGHPDAGSVGPLPRGEVTIVGGRTGIGKSAFVAQVAAYNARKGRHVLMASAEMTTRQLLDRFRVEAAGVPLHHLRHRAYPLTLDERRRLDAATFPPVRLFDQAGMTTGDIRALVGRFAVTQPLDLVVVDHLHHLSDVPLRNETRYLQVGRMVAALKEIAKRHHCVMLVAAQLNRQAATKPPTLADLRDAGTIEEYADIVLFLHRDEDESPQCTIHVAKNRNGPSYRIDVYHDRRLFRFRDLDRPRTT
jgi:replicative DNA helicase